MSVNVIGVRFREAAKIYHYAPPEAPLAVGEYVVVETPRGPEMALVVTASDADADEGPVPTDVKPILRLASGDDRAQAEAMRHKADTIVQRLNGLVRERNLSANIVGCDLTLAGDAGVCYFTAADPVDLHPLLAPVQEEFAIKITLRQVGDRDRAKLIDGYGICGLRLCCASWMTEFPQVGIRMAKAQSLSLNPDKISGVCGRLLCCLTFEYEVYREMRGKLPKLGKMVSTPAGQGRVRAVNALKGTATIELVDSRERVEVTAAETGYAVRVEEAPNQALTEAAAPAPPPPTTPSDSEASPEGEAPKRKRRRRRRRTGSVAAPETVPEAEAGSAAPPREPPSTTGAAAPAERTATPRRRRRRRRRGGAGPTTAPPS